MVGASITKIASASNMKAFVLSVFCTLVGNAVGGAVGWNGAVAYSAPLALSTPVLKTIVPGQTKTTAYSTTQYINSIPGSYSFGVQPQLAYQVPHVNNFAPLPTGYYSIANPAYIPAASIYYPTHPSLISAFGPPSLVSSISPSFPSAPLAPSTPAPISPALPSQPPSIQSDQSSGDADSTVVDSIDFNSQQQSGQIPQSDSASQFLPSNSFSNIPSNTQSTQEESPSFPSRPSSPSSFPQYAQIPQIPQNPQQPQLPQESQTPSFPSFPQLPQLPQGITPSFPQLPQLPQFPQNPSSPAQNPQDPQPAQNPSFPQFPQFPQNLFPQAPSQPASSFPASGNQNQAFNDDSVTVESA